MIDTIQVFAEQLLFFSINYFIHSTVLVGLVLLAFKFKLLVFDRLGEWVLKLALMLGCVTALVQTNGWLPSSVNSWFIWQVPIESVQKTAMPQQASPTNGVTAGSTQDSPVLHPNSESIKVPTNLVQPLVTETNIKPNSIEADEQNANQGILNDHPRNKVNGSWIWLLLWSLGMTCLLLRHSNNHWQWHQLMKHRKPVSNVEIQQLYSELLERSELSERIKLSHSSVLTSPIALHREVVCPSNFLKKNNKENIEAALAHELAHIKRYDGVWLNIVQWLQVVLFFQPLNRVLMHHIHQAAEQRADSMATTWTDNPRALAITLVDVAQANQSFTQQHMVPAMTSKKSKLLQRVENIMQPNQAKSSRLLTFGLFSALLLIIITGPGVVAQTKASFKASGSSYHNISIDGGVTDVSITSSRDDRKLKLKARLKSEIEFNADETAITSFPTNSRFDLTHTEGGIKRRVLIESAPGANKENAAYTYWYDGDEQVFDAQARQWLTEVMPMVWRETGLQSETRVKRIRENHGDDGVLDEVAMIESNFVRKSYMNHLFNLSELDENDLERALTLAAEIESDFELSSVLSELVKTQNLSSEDIWLAFFASAESIGSDFEMAKTLLNVLPQLPSSENINQAYFVAAESIDSDFEMAKVLIAYLEHNANETVNVENLFALAEEIGSDFELAKVMLAANRHIGQSNASDELFTTYLNLAAHIGSDFEMNKVYSDLLKHNLSTEHLERIIEAAAEQIGSDFELASLLLSISRKQANNDAIKSRIKTATKSIGSQFERNRVLASLI